MLNQPTTGRSFNDVVLALRQPTKLFGASGLTLLLVAPFPIAFLLIMPLGMGVAAGMGTGSHLGEAIGVAAALFGAACLLLVPFGLVSAGFDFFAARARKREAAIAAAREAERAIQYDSDALRAAVLSTRDALWSIYADHRAALAAEVRRLSSPDRYGRIDAAPIDAEFRMFFREVARPELVAQRHDGELVDVVYDIERPLILADTTRAAAQPA